MDIVRIKQFYHHLMPELQHDEWQWLADRFTERWILKGDLLITEGKVVRDVSFINQGIVSYSLFANGKEINKFFTLEGGYVTDYTSFLTQQPSQAHIEALEDTHVIELSYKNVQEGYATIPALQKFGRIMAEYLFMQVSQNMMMRFTCTPEQLYQSLLDTQPELLQRIPQYMIASHIGITPEALSRIRKRMTARVA
jgi:CRP/FNR family transcriptional regulator, anaerobic regulatory protein